MSKSIWRGRNTIHIMKTGIECTIALASLAAAITTVLIATNVIAVPESLALVNTIANPVGIAILFVVAAYFFMLAISSYQQMHRNEETSDAKTSGGDGEVEAKIADLATKTELSTKADKTEVEAKIAGLATKTGLNTKADKAALEKVQKNITDLTADLNKKLNSDDFNEKFKSSLDDLSIAKLLKDKVLEIEKA